MGNGKRVGSPEKGHSMINMEQYVIFGNRKGLEKTRDKGVRPPKIQRRETEEQRSLLLRSWD